MATTAAVASATCGCTAGVLAGVHAHLELIAKLLDEMATTEFSAHAVQTANVRHAPVPRKRPQAIPVASAAGHTAETCSCPKPVQGLALLCTYSSPNSKFRWSRESC
ncbi:hypothetical protein SELMODRAFT_421158 [Selaginella moellendorffii]|uniref:Uncharacterized protein n=1 Tax=Selaginella moellendorffii TaxID=88036 RepID=D8SEP6_SELML|nr:hypothetical protein SELMODRAFT_421158 [Selaginella moellendorffii]